MTTRARRQRGGRFLLLHKTYSESLMDVPALLKIFSQSSDHLPSHAGFRVDFFETT